MEKIRGKLRSRSKELLIIGFFLLFSLRVVTWFEYPFIIVGGDFKPPLVSSAFTKRVMFAWDETDFGLPSVYSPRILDPFYFLVTAFQTLGVSLYVSQIVSVFLLYFFSSALMYLYVRQLTNGDHIAAFVAALFLTSNIHLVTDRELTAIGFMDTALMILPSLVAFTQGIKSRSYKFMAISGLLFALTNGVFPNYAVSLMCLITTGLTCLFLLFQEGFEVNYSQDKAFTKRLQVSIDVKCILTYLKLISVFIVSLLLTSIWIAVIILKNLNTFLGFVRATEAPVWVMEHISFHDVLRLISKWGFYESAWGHPYVFYASRYLQNGDPLLILLTYIPPLLAFSSLLISKSRKLTVFFSATAVASIFLTMGFKPFLSGLYFAVITNAPLMIAFREPMKWIFFLILSYCVLIGFVLSHLCHKLGRKSTILALGLIVMLFISTSFPLMTGDVTRNWLRPETKGGYFPPSYVEVNNRLSDDHWAVLAPQRHTYLSYNFTQSPLNVGNPFPLIFSKPIISGLGTEYLHMESPDLIDKIYQQLETESEYQNVAPIGKASASSFESVGREPDKANDDQMQTRWASSLGLPQWFEIEWNDTKKISKINIFFENAYAEDFSIETWNGTSWISSIAVKNNTDTQRSFDESMDTSRLRIYFANATRFNLISIWELQVYAQTEGAPKFLGMLGIKNVILEKNLVSGNLSSADELKLDEKGFALQGNWEEITLYENAYSLQKLYVADKVQTYSSLSDICLLTKESDWSTLQGTAFVNATTDNGVKNLTLAIPDSFTWSELSPVEYQAHMNCTKPFILGFLENYDENWKLYVNGNPLPETNHLKDLNGFANGWIIDAPGDLTLTIQYQTQGLLTISAAASIILPLLLILLLSTKELKNTASAVFRRLKSSESKNQEEKT